jgi:hypothetical protein
MPYYIYRIKPFTQLEKLSELPTFQAASHEAKALRASAAPLGQDKIKVIFADNELQAEDLLCQVRTASPRGDD